MARRSIKALLEELLDEERVVDLPDGRVNREITEKALYRTAITRALDPRNRLGMESLRFITEYVHGAAAKQVNVSISAADPLEDASEEELLALQEKLMKGAMDGSHTITPRDPTRFLEAGKRDEVISHVLAARGKLGKEAEGQEEEGAAAGEEGGVDWSVPARAESPVGAGEADGWPEDTDDLLKGPWDV